jgi:hypothetical protein
VVLGTTAVLLAGLRLFSKHCTRGTADVGESVRIGKRLDKRLGPVYRSREALKSVPSRVY